MFFRLGFDFRAGPSVAFRRLTGRFLILPGFALLIVPAEPVPSAFINIFKAFAMDKELTDQMVNCLDTRLA
jgi:hypothetical protein